MIESLLAEYVTEEKQRRAADADMVPYVVVVQSLHPLEIVSVSLAQLAEPIASLAAEGGRIIQALDDLLHGPGVE